MYEILATFKGIVPMMQDRFFNPEELEPGRRKRKGKGTRDKEIDLKLHRDNKGVYVPADNIRMMLIGNRFRKGAATILGSYIETKKASMYLEMCEACIWVLGPDDPMKIYIQPKRKTYDIIDERPHTQKDGTRGISRRPVINLPWSLDDFIIQVTDDRIDESKVRELYETAVLRCGVCAYGPTFGRCIITQWEIRKGKK